MNVSDHQLPVVLRLVAMGTNPSAARPGRTRPHHLQLVADDGPRAQLLNTMTIIAGARRQAMQRIKQQLWVGDLVILCLVALLVATLAGLAWFGPALEAGFQQKLVSVVLGAAILALLLTVRHDKKSAIGTIHQLADCVSAIEILQLELNCARGPRSSSVYDVRQRYAAALRRCGATHNHCDYLAARLTPNARSTAIWRARLYHAMSVYFANGLGLSATLLLLLFGAV